MFAVIRELVLDESGAQILDDKNSLPTTLLQISPASRYLVRVATPSLGQVSS